MDFRQPRGRILLITVLARSGWERPGATRYLQLVRYTIILPRAAQQRLIVEVSPSRGDILDRNLAPLAMRFRRTPVFAVPSEIADPSMVAQLLSGPLDLSPMKSHRVLRPRAATRVWRNFADTVSRIERST